MSGLASGYASLHRCPVIRRIEDFVYLQDTAGQEKYRALASSYYRGAQGAILGIFMLPVWIQHLDSNASVVIQCTMFPTGTPLRPSFGGTGNLKPTFLNLSSRSSLVTRLTRSVVRRLRSTPPSTLTQESSREVSTFEGEAFARRMNALFIETSAKTAVGVSEAFREVVEKILDTPELWTPSQHAGTSDSMTDGVDLNPNKPQSRGGCAC